MPQEAQVERLPFHSTDEFLEHCRGVMRLRRLSLRTEDSYLFYIRHYIRFFRRRPEQLGAEHVAQFLTHLAARKNVAASTQNVAFSALLFLYREILHTELEGIDAVRARRSRRTPVVLSRSEITRLLA